MTRFTNGFAILLFLTAPVFGQKAPTAGGGGASTTTTTPGGGTTPTSSPIYNNPNVNNPNNNPSNDPFGAQPIFLSGKVMFDDGSPINKDIRIERVCGGNVRIESHVDNGGHFSFEVGGNTGAADSIMDASQSEMGGNSSRVSGLQNPGSVMGGSNTGSSRRLSPEQTLWGCDLRASYPGYRSESLSLAGRKSLDDPNVGVIILHRLANVQGTTISITTAEAPKSAQKNYDKGVQAGRKGNLDEAERRLLAATGEYPKYAIAWFALGQVQERQNRPEDARKSYLAAANADKHYVSPYDELALLAAHDNKWAEAAQFSKQAIDLNPIEFPASYWYNAVANYNLNRDADAIKSAKALLKLDTLHRFPEVNRLLADLSVKTKDYTAAAEYLKAYLTLVPAAKDAELLKQQLLKIEEAKAQIQQ